MPIQQTNSTNSYESAVSSLLAALAQGTAGQGDAAAFQTQLASSLNTVAPQVPARAGEQPVGSAGSRKAKAKVRPTKDDNSGAAVGAANQSQPQASVATAGSGGATASQDNSASVTVAPVDSSPAVQSGTTTTTTATTVTAANTTPTTTTSSTKETPTASSNDAGSLSGNNNGAGNAAAVPADNNVSGPSQSSLGSAPVADETPAVAPVASGKTGRGAGEQKTAKDQPQTNSATASTETATPAGQKVPVGNGSHATNVALQVGPSEAAGAKAQTATQNDAEMTNTAVTPTDGSSSSSSTQPVAKSDAARTSAAKTAEFQQATQGLSLQSMAVRSEMAGGPAATAAGTNGAAASSEAASGGGTSAVAAVGLSGSQAATPAARAGAAVPTGTAEQPDQAAQVEQIVRAMQSDLVRGGGRVTLQLSPPELGRLRVQMQIRGSDLTANFQTDDEASQTLLQNSMPQLREALASQGMRLVDATVQIQGGAAQHPGGQAGGWSGAGNFGQGAQTGGRQAGTGGQQYFGQAAETEPAATAPWNTSVEDESRVNVVV